MNTQTQSNPWLAFTRQHTDTPLRMLCFPYAGGGASFYRDWNNDLPAQVEILPVQLPGHETRIKEQLISELEPLLDAAIDGLSNALDRPFVLFGHSMGALVAFEFARRLRLEKDIIPARLIVSGYKAPHFPYQSALRHDLPDDQFITELANLNGTPKEALQSPELMEFMMPMLRADSRVCDLYKYHDAAPLPCPITAYGGTDDKETSLDSLQAWGIHTSSDFQYQTFSGGHFFPQTNRHEFITSLSKTVKHTLNGLHTG